MNGVGWKAAVDAIFMMAPPRVRIVGNSRPVSCTRARTLTSIISRCRERFGSGKRPYAPKPLLLMSKTRPAGVPPSQASTWRAACSTSLERDKSHRMWRKHFSSENFAGSVRDRLQIRIPGCIFTAKPMNDCPRPEDPPVTTAQVKDRKTSLSEVYTSFGSNFSHSRMPHPAMANPKQK